MGNIRWVANFKRNLNGKIVFYPWGIFGKGFVLESAAQASQLHSLMNRFLTLALVAVCIIGLIFRPFIMEILLAPYLIACWAIYRKQFRKITNGLELSGQNLSTSEVLKTSSMDLLWLLLSLLGVSSFGVFFAGLANIVFRHKSPTAVHYGWLELAICVPIFIFSSWVISKRAKL